MSCETPMSYILSLWSIIYVLVMSIHLVCGFTCDDSQYQTFEIDDRCYIYVKARKDRTSSKLLCVAYIPKEWCNDRGLHLPRIVSMESISSAISADTFFKANIKERSKLWLGAVYRSSVDRFVWDDSNEVVSANVVSGEQTSRRRGNCVYMTGTFKTVTVACDWLLGSQMLCMAIRTHWFGPNLNYRCNCREGGCLHDGSCPEAGGKCSLGWFGPGCQFRDLLLDVDNNLTDFSDETCWENTSSPQTFVLLYPFYLIWIRIVTTNAGEFNDFVINVFSNDQEISSVQTKFIVINNRTVDIYCSTALDIVSSFSLNFKGNRTLCSVHIFGGQNVALKEPTNMSSAVGDYQAALADDGEMSPLSHSATTSVAKELHRAWSLQFPTQKIVYEIVAILPARYDNSLMNIDFSLELISPSNTTILNQSSPLRGRTQRIFRWVYPSGTFENIKAVTIRLSTTNSTLKRLDFLEVEIFGACRPPFYGVYCNQICKKEHSFCHYNGESFEFFYGNYSLKYKRQNVYEKGVERPDERTGQGRLRSGHAPQQAPDGGHRPGTQRPGSAQAQGLGAGETEPPDDESDATSLGPDAITDLTNDTTAATPGGYGSAITTVILVIIVVDLVVVPFCCVYCWCRGQDKPKGKGLKKPSGSGSGEDNSSEMEKRASVVHRKSEDAGRSLPSSDDNAEIADVADVADVADTADVADEELDSRRKGSILMRALAHVSAFRGTLYDNRAKAVEDPHRDEDKDSGLMEDFV